jgi:hypothetical protein
MEMSEGNKIHDITGGCMEMSEGNRIHDITGELSIV